VEVRLVAGDGSVVASVTADGLQDGARPATPSGGDDAREATIEHFVDDDAFEETGTDPGEIVVRGENLPTRPAGGPPETSPMRTRTVICSWLTVWSIS
jgi:hypothetical protein